jgi:hypothetical protein
MTYLVVLVDDRNLVPDTYLDLVSGRYIAHHWVPHGDTLTIAGGRWTDQQWLADLTFWGSFRVGGYALVLIVCAILVGAAYGLLALFMTSRGVAPQRAALWAIFALIASDGWGEVRAQSFSYLPFVALLWIGCNDERRTRFSLRFPAFVLPLLVLWGNLHGTAVLGAGLVAVYGIARAGLAESVRDHGTAAGYLLTSIAAPLALLLTPYGLSTASYYHRILGQGNLVQHVASEWTPPTLTYPFTWAMLLLALITVSAVVYGLRRERKPSATLVGATIITAGLATQAQRYEIWFALTWIPLAAMSLAGLGSSSRPTSTRATRTINTTILIAIAVVAALVTLSVSSLKVVRFEGFVPLKAVTATERVLACDPTATVLSDHYGADSLLWLDPSSIRHVAYDGRLEIYNKNGLTRFIRFIIGSNVAQIANDGGYDVLIASEYDARLDRAIEHLQGWRTLTRGKGGVAAVRAGSRAASCVQ